MKPVLLDSRRLTGANLYWDSPSAVIDVQLGDGYLAIVEHWQASVAELLDSCGMPDQETTQRLYSGGASLLVSAPIDALYAMCELNEVAWAMALSRMGMDEPPDMPAEIARLASLFQAERRPRLLAMHAAAQQHSVPFLWDDDEVSIGFGASCQTWAYEDLPDIADIDWASIGSIPVALVTGTNGKSTTVRMVATIMKAAGLRGGLTSTDFIRVGDKTIDEGDYSGTGGARMLLRDSEVQAAVLEVARGGLLRRGLAVERADAALITNVAADHLGEYGINTVPELIEAKFIVHRALDEQSPLILNADDAGLVAYEKELRARKPGTTWWFSLQQDNTIIRNCLAAGQGACWVEDGQLFSNINARGEVHTPRLLMSINDITASRGGMQRHNLQNALGAALLSLALGLPGEAIRKGLEVFRGDESDNPGRGNWYEHSGVHIVVDFAHNEHGMRALADSVLALEGKRVILMMSQAGDRSDDAIRGLTRAALSMHPDRLLICQLPGYERGRDLKAPPGVIRDEAISLGMQAGQLFMLPNLLEAARQALNDAREGDVLVLLALTQRKEILQLVHKFISA